MSTITHAEDGLNGAALAALAGLLRVRHAIDDEIAKLIGQTPTPGHIGEVVAAAIFDIELEASGVNAGYDGTFLVEYEPLHDTVDGIRRSLAALESAIEAGYRDSADLRSAADLAPLRALPEFQRFMGPNKP